MTFISLIWVLRSFSSSFIVIILIVVLLIFGPKNLPKLGKALGNAFDNLRKGVESGKEKIDEKFEEVEAEKAQAENEEIVETPDEQDAESAKLDE